jgi:hypothetical protein
MIDPNYDYYDDFHEGCEDGESAGWGTDEHGNERD